MNRTFLAPHCDGGLRRKLAGYFLAALAIAGCLSGSVLCAMAGTTATIATDQKLYSVGQGMVITGTAFTPGAQITVSVLRPDQVTDYVPGVFSDANGGFSANYAPPYEPGRYRITASDGVNTAMVATTEADAIGYNKAVYNKANTSYAGGAGQWTSGNAGSNYLEGQWAFYQYEFTGVGTTIPDADVSFNHFQTNTNAVFVDAFANFRACVDCTDSTNLSGPSQGMLADGNFAPPLSTLNWVNAGPAISRINDAFSSANVCTTSFDAVNSPSEYHCFHVDGAALKAVLNAGLNAKNGTSSVDYFATGTHTVTLYYAAHLAATPTWGHGQEYLLGCSGSAYFAILSGQGGEFVPASTVYGTNAYNPTAGGPCSKDGNSWTATSFLGIGYASGSSRHFNLENQSLGSSGAITLPIPGIPAPSGSITVVKVTNPASAVGATFNFSGDLGTFSLDTDPNTTTPNSSTFSGLTGGFTYVISETGLSTGWSNTNIACVNNTGSSTFSYSPSADGGSASVALATTANAAVTCTFTNTSAATLKLIKAVDNSNGGTAAATQWTVRATGPTTIFGAGSVGPTTVPTGTYTLSETGSVAGYTNGTSYSCVKNGGAAVSGNSITLANGDSAVCTITNHDNPASLQLVKNVVNNWGGTAAASSWTLSASGPTPISGAGGVGPSNVSAGAYTLSESGSVAGYTNGTTYSCVVTPAGGTAGAPVSSNSLTLGVGDSAICTITNTNNAARLQLVKTVVNNWGGTATASSWTLSASGPTPLSGAGGVAATNVSAGTYTLSESGSVAGYANGTTYSCVKNGGAAVDGNSITLALGDSAVCTITNTNNPASLQLVKNVVNNWGGTASASSWTLSASGPTPLSGAGGVAATNVSVGTYTLSESGSVAGYSNGSTYSCVKNGGAAVDGNSITLDLGDTAVCTITNRNNPASLQLVKTVVNNYGGSAAATSWTLSASGPTPLSGAGGVAATNVSVGTYTLSESGTVAGYTNGTTYSCVKNGGAAVGTNSITLGLGDTAVCTISNHDNPAHLTLVKQVISNWGTAASSSNWLLSAAAGSTTVMSGVSGSAAVTNVALSAGTYNLGEAGDVSGYSNGSAYTCVTTPPGGAAGPAVVSNTVTLSVGNSAVCTITNSDNPATIIINKYTTGGVGRFSFNIDGPDSSTQTVTTSFLNGGPNGSGSVTVYVHEGSYTLEEVLQYNSTLTGFECDKGAATTLNAQNIPTQWAFSLARGDTVTCNLVNSAPLTTRTQGFWATHTGLANAVWSGVNFPNTGVTQVIGSGDEFLCTETAITAIPLQAQNQLMGGFWSGISQKSNNKKRTPIDQARMQLLQQYLAAVLNSDMFGSGTPQMLQAARAAYCTGTSSDIQAQIGILGSFNSSGDAQPFTPGASATAKESRYEANIPFWDTTIR